MHKLLMVDDDPAMRAMLRLRLSDTYEIVETGEPEQGLALALSNKPDAILMDLMMPNCSGFELCQSLSALSYTAMIPIFVVSGGADGKYKEHCLRLGAKGYFEKPVNFVALKKSIQSELNGKAAERRAHVRVRMHMPIKLQGADAEGKPFEESTATDNISAGGFLCSCKANLMKDTIVAVYVAGDRLAGRARVARRESPGAPWQKYGFEFLEKTEEWVLQTS